METDLLRRLLLEYLREIQNVKSFSLQYQYCISGIESVATRRCPEQMQKIRDAEYRLPDSDKTRSMHVIWDLILNRVLVPGTSNPNTLNDGWPFLSLTDHGREVVNATEPVPYDPDGYLASIPLLTSTAKTYLAESLTTLRTNNQLAAAVMLGVASETVFDELCVAIAAAIQDMGKRRRFEELTNAKKNMQDRKKAVVEWLHTNKAQLPTAWRAKEQIDVIDKIADLIRYSRNEAGHPQNPPTVRPHQEIYALLVIFRRYCEQLCELKKWLEDHPASI